MIIAGEFYSNADKYSRTNQSDWDLTDAHHTEKLFIVPDLMKWPIISNAGTSLVVQPTKTAYTKSGVTPSALSFQ